MKIAEYTNNGIIYRTAKNNEIAEMQAQMQEYEQSAEYRQYMFDALKNELAEYDYIGTKIAMGVATVEEYAEKIAYTETLRRKIRELEENA